MTKTTLTNAERQRRFRERQKVKIASSSAGMKETIERAIAEYNHDCKDEDGFVPFTLDDYTYHLAGGQEVDEYGVEWIEDAINEAIFNSFAVTDPWPGLTRKELVAMIGERKGRALYDRGLDSVKGDTGSSLSLREKVCAARNRDWLESSASPTRPKRRASQH